jgi:hypothetical protein
VFGGANGYTLPTEKLEHREAAFVIDRDIGKVAA